ncbi:MAG: hypothetical protein VX535_07905, partial [Pseudomonadota bacterium]|nr:hypothetical protein [Pseudomonadota bacterium]
MAQTMRFFSGRGGRMFSNAAGSGGVLPAGAVDFFKRRLTEIFAALLFLSAAWLLFAIISYSPSDP